MKQFLIYISEAVNSLSFVVGCTIMGILISSIFLNASLQSVLAGILILCIILLINTFILSSHNPNQLKMEEQNE